MLKDLDRILIIQTAFIGDVVLATPLLEQLKSSYPEARIDFLLRKGNENLLENDDRVNDILIWNKKRGKNRELFRLIRKIRKRKYDLLINVQRFASMGLLTWFSGAKHTVGFDKNPFSFSYAEKVTHQLDGTHEVERNLSLLKSISETPANCRPSLQLSQKLTDKVAKYKQQPYLTIAATSVWFTKQFPPEKWIDFLKNTSFSGNIYLLGGPSDREASESIRSASSNSCVTNLCGELSLMESVALMRDARMNYVNDSAPLHFASAVNAPTTAIFCSTVPKFGFGPLSDDSVVIETDEELDCRPCGLHGYDSCPRGHFKCASTIHVERLEKRIFQSTTSK